jgi:hypothetical protein
MSTLKEIEKRQEKMYKLIDEMYAEEDMTKMLMIVQQLEKEAGELQEVCFAFQEKMDKMYPKKTVPRFEVVLTKEQREIIFKETKIKMETVTIEDMGGSRNAAMPITHPSQILKEALRQAREMAAVQPIKEAAQKKIAAALADVEAGGPLYAEAVAKFKADPVNQKILSWDKKK